MQIEVKPEANFIAGIVESLAKDPLMQQFHRDQQEYDPVNNFSVSHKTYIPSTSTKFMEAASGKKEE